MKIIILEGIATSGKTSVRIELKKILLEHNIKCTFVHEDDVLMSLYKQLDRETTIKNLHSLIKKNILPDTKVIIFDRFHLTYISDPKKSHEEFKEIYDLLNKEHALTCVFKIPEKKIQERVEMAMSHRDPTWATHIIKKGKNLKEVISWYRKAQRDLIKKVKEIPVPYTIFDTSNLEFHNIAHEIYKLLEER